MLITFKDAIRLAQEECLKDPSVFLIGEGVGDPKNIFGTTAGLKEKFPDQVFDMPVSENGVTGVCIGAALNGFKPILVHQRIDFSLYSMDQIVNNAAKWFSMFGGQKNVPLVIRMIIGRGWGQGNQHSQNLSALFAHVPGLKVFIPSNAYDAKRLLIKAVKDPNPVLFIENRWLYETTSEDIPQTTATHLDPDITLVAIGHAVLEARKAMKACDDLAINLIELQEISPLSVEDVYGDNFIVVDDAWRSGGLAGEIGMSLYENGAKYVKRITCPDYPSASSSALTKDYYPSANKIIRAINAILDKEIPLLPERDHHDVPDSSFRGPF